MLDKPLNDIRAAVAQISGLHAAGQLQRADMAALVQLVEERTDELEVLLGIRPAVLTLPVLTLADVAANARARAGGKAARHLKVVQGGTA